MLTKFDNHQIACVMREVCHTHGDKPHLTDVSRILCGDDRLNGCLGEDNLRNGCVASLLGITYSKTIL